MKRYLLLILTLILGIALGWCANLLFATPKRSLVPIPQFDETVRTHLEEVNISMLKNNERMLHQPPTISFLENQQFFIRDGKLDEGGFANFSGRLVAWNTTPTPPNNWNDRLGDGPALSLYYHRGVLYCVERHSAQMRYMIEQGQVRLIVSTRLPNLDELAQSAKQSIQQNDNRFSAWQLSESGYLTHKSRIDDAIPPHQSAWSPNEQRWEHSYRTDFFLAQGSSLLTLSTGRDGELHRLIYHYSQDSENRQRVLDFDPQGRIVADYDNRVD